MALEFMTGATVFALINLTLVLLVGFFVHRLARKIHAYVNDETGDGKLKYGFELASLIVIFIIMIFFGSATQPKLSIDTPQNRDLIEYQNETEEIVIEPAPPRTETLKGFEPLKD